MTIWVSKTTDEYIYVNRENDMNVVDLEYIKGEWEYISTQFDDERDFEIYLREEYVQVYDKNLNFLGFTEREL